MNSEQSFHRFYCTFRYATEYRNNFVVIQAVNKENAVTIANERFGNVWSMIYDNPKSAGIKRFKLEEIGIKGEENEIANT